MPGWLPAAGATLDRYGGAGAHGEVTGGAEVRYSSTLLKRTMHVYSKGALMQGALVFELKELHSLCHDVHHAVIY